MDDTQKTAEQLLEEIYSLRRRIAELEASEAELSRIRKFLDRGSESLRMVIEEALDATGVVDGHGVIRYMSPSIEKMTGYAVEELIGKSVFDYVHPDDIVELRADFSRGTMTLAQTHKRQFRYRHADGSWHVVESTGINLLEDPAVAGLVVTARDVTKRIMIEKSLKESEERYRVLIESQGVGICEIDNEDRFVFGNAEAHRILGVANGELPGRSLREFADEEDLEIVREQGRLRRQGVRSTYDVAIIRPAGERRILRITGTPRMDENGKLVASLGVFSDITEVKEAEEALERSQRYYRSLIRNAGDMISIVDAELNFRWGSPAAGRITGHDPADIYGKPLFDYIHPDDIAMARGKFRSIEEKPGASFAVEAQFRHGDGSYHLHAVVVTNLLEDPAVRGLVINSRDINERKIMEEELVVRNQELDAFARTVAHDLRTPLSLIEGYAQLLQEGRNSDEEKNSYLENIINAVRHMDELTESLLEYAQVGHSSGEISAVEAGEVVQEVLLQQAKTLKRNNIEIEVKKGLPVVMVDEIKLRQVFANLLDNAIKYMSDNGDPRIEIGTRPAEGEVIFYLKDNGRGIKEEQQSEIFQPFKRFAGSASPGLGIGLSTVKLAVQGWGGRIWVESSPGQGSTFFFTAPF